MSAKKSATKIGQAKKIIGENNNVGDDKLPLLDEVDELLEKERLLFSLKLLEKEKETNEWKEKYEKSINLVTSKPLGVSKLTNKSKQEIDESFNIVNSNDDRNNIGSKLLLYKASRDNNIIDLSNTHIDDINETLHQINKIIISHKSIKFLYLKNCQLSDENTDRLIDILSHNCIEAVDLSFNELGCNFTSKFFEIMKNFRRTAQYILLEGNLEFTSFDKSIRTSLINSLINSLSDSTWGLSLTLQDFDIMRGTAAVKQSSKGFYDTPSHLMMSHMFLSQINNKLDPTNAASIKIKDKKKTKITDKYRGGLQLLTCLALTNAQLSKLSIKELFRTLKLTSSTLTDLDLSFSYIGYLGAIMLRDFLQTDECQLVRLGLKGNAIGNNGFNELSQAFQINQSLIYIDCQSNDISSTTIRLCINRIIKNKILYKLNLINNDISYDCRIDIQRMLYENGNTLNIIWDYSSRNDENVIDSKLFIPRKGIDLYRYDHKVIKSISALGEVLLYQIDLKRLNTHYESHKSHNIGISWLWKPSSRVSYSHTSSHLNKPLHWKYHINIINKKGNLISSHQYNEDSSKFTRNNYTNEYGWIHSSFVLSNDFPTDGSMNISIHCSGSKSVYESNVTSCQLLVYTIPTDNYVLCRENDINGSYESIANLQLPSYITIPENFNIIRSIRWIDIISSTGVLSFDVKLNKLLNDNFNILTIGYTVNIAVIRSNQNKYDELISIISNNTTDVIDGIPLAWQWSNKTVNLTNMKINDIIIILTKLDNSDNGNIVTNCFLTIKNLELLVNLPDNAELLKSTNLNSNIAYNSGVNVVFNHNL